MSEKQVAEIQIKGARTNNLKDINIRIPHHQFVVVTGVSGSGKSSLIFDVIAKEGQRRYFETLPSFSRQFVGKLSQPDVDSISGLSPVIAIGQKTVGVHARSTVGTVSDLYDVLRLLFARKGESEKNIPLSRSLFSFNTEVGRCPKCVGIGKEEEIDVEKLVAHPEKSIREGALAPTLPTGYIMYSQVTIDVLNQVCEAEGFNVEIPWNELADAQQKVILYGSEKIKVPFGKHSLESRLKWTGIKAKPREEGFYKGMIPIMSDILRRDRNPNILKYVTSVTCKECKGERINADARSVHVHGKTITELTRMELNELKEWITQQHWDEVGQKIVSKLSEQTTLLADLGLGHLSLDREASTLSASEIQRLRVANQLTSSLSDVLYIFDEPSIGLHSEENKRMIFHLKELVRKGNSVIVVEHDLTTIRHADWIVDVGPQAGTYGGEILFNGSFDEFIQRTDLLETSATLKALISPAENNKANIQGDKGAIELKGCTKNNLKNVDVSFQLGKLNVVSGPSGSGKSSLVKGTLMEITEDGLRLRLAPNSKFTGRLSGAEATQSQHTNLIYIDQSPIGKTPRSNPATYLGISDHIRDLFAKLPLAKERLYTKSRFSFNNKGGRCETCQGAGKTQIGMHFLGNVDLLCGECNGKRFNAPTLEVTYNEKSIAEIYEMRVNEAVTFFADQPKILSGIQTLNAIGLGYLTLGQSSTTLSGGEAQRIKLANQLQKKESGSTLYIIAEPSTGLHHQDVQTLLNVFNQLTEKGNTIVCIEQDETIIQQSDWHIEMGPESGKKGGFVMYQGAPRKQAVVDFREKDHQHSAKEEIQLEGVATNQLKEITVRIPKRQLTTVTGLSGSGKSSLVYDTLFVEANARFTESFSAYNRSLIQASNNAVLTDSDGLGPSIALRRKSGATSNRSTVGTLSGIYDAIRLLYARIGAENGRHFSAQNYSFNHHSGACESCGGMGVQLKCDPYAVIVHPEKSIFDGAISSNKSVGYYGDENGQFIATLNTLASQKKWELDLPWSELSAEQQRIILYGDESELDVTWTFKTKSRTGTQQLKAKWLGFCNYLDDEYQRRLSNKNKESLEAMLHEVTCTVCNGSRLKMELLETQFLGLNIHELTQLTVQNSYKCLSDFTSISSKAEKAIAQAIIPGIQQKIKPLLDLGLGHLSLNRSVKSLSGGEHQRIALAGQFSADLYGVTYVLDEPTIGLDAKQIDALIELLKGLVAKGNTVVAVEHDRQFIQSSDYIIEMGPGAGKAGGEVVFQGRNEALKDHANTLTYQLLTSDLPISATTFNKVTRPFGVKDAYLNNLKHIDVPFNSGEIIAITGVSGSGKSTLIRDVLYQSYLKNRPMGCASVFGLDQFDEVMLMDQRPFTGNRLSTVASLTDLLEELRSEFAKSQVAKTLGFKKADFSYQSKNGKCGACGGLGQQKTSLDFMGDVWTTCDVCNGKRYNSSILQCTLNGKSIGEVLEMTIHEAHNFFESKRIKAKLQMLKDVGIGHLQLGQSGAALSGGEAQRLKLATQLITHPDGKSLYLFDEPSTGLHQQDIFRLIEVFQQLVEKGNTVLFIEHNDVLINCANQLVRLGPESGELGGRIVQS